MPSHMKRKYNEVFMKFSHDDKNNNTNYSRWGKYI